MTGTGSNAAISRLRADSRRVHWNGLHPWRVSNRAISDYLGVLKFRHREAEDGVGVVTGLVWTDVGGELLTIKGAMVPDKVTRPS